MMMKIKHPAAKQIKENLHKAMTKSIEDEMCARVGASAANTLKVGQNKYLLMALATLTIFRRNFILERFFSERFLLFTENLQLSVN